MLIVDGKNTPPDFMDEMVSLSHEPGRAYLAFCCTLNSNPRSDAAHFGIGEIFRNAQMPEVALPALLTASDLQPDNCVYAAAVARTLIALDQRDHAASRLALAHRANPNDQVLREIALALSESPKWRENTGGGTSGISDTDLNNKMAQAFGAVNAGQLETAFQLATELIWAGPQIGMTWIILCYAAQTHPCREYAELCARRAIAINPKNPEAWSSLSRILNADSERIAESEQVLRCGIDACWPEMSLVHKLCTYLHDQDRYEDALQLIATIEARTGKPTGPLLRLRAETHAAAGDLEAAHDVFRSANEVGSTSTDTLIAAADFYDRQVDQSPLIELFKKAREDGVSTNNGVLLDAWARSLLRVGDTENAHTNIQRALATQASPSQLKSRLFTLGAIEDKRGNYQQAYTAVTKANQLMEDISETRGACDHGILTRRLQSLRTRLSHERNSSRTEFHDASCGPDNIAFLVGFPRSGTTLLDTILRSHSKITVIEEEPLFAEALRKAVPGIWGDETNFNENWLDTIHTCDPSILRAHYLRGMTKFAKQKLNDDQIYIDKLPLNMHWAPLIHSIFPRALFILAVRHPLDAAISNFFQDYRANNAMMNMTSIERISTLYDQSFSFWDEFEAGRQPNVQRVRYEGLIDNLKDAVSPVMEKLGLQWEGAQSDFHETAMRRGRIKTPSYTQVTQKLYSSARERWRNYHFAFEKNDSFALRQWAVRHGYRTSLEGPEG